MKPVWLLPVLILSLLACNKEQPAFSGDYPEDIGQIVRTRCSISGCHNVHYKDSCNGLDLSNWHALFRGSNNNSVVIPFQPELSILYLLINPEFHQDHVGMMPKYGEALSDLEVLQIRNWILTGARNRAGGLRFHESPARSMIYVANQGCDLVTVFDAESKMISGTIRVGRTNSVEAPHDMFVSPDGRYLYLSFFANSMMQRFETLTGAPAGEIEFNDWGWHSMSVSGDSKFALVSHLNGDGKVCLVDLEKMQVVIKYQGGGYFIYPHGSALSHDGKLAYITCQQGNFIYKMDLSDPYNPEQTMIPLSPGTLPTPIGLHKPYEVEFSPDYSKYFVSCQGTNEIRVFSTYNDSLTDILETSGVPQLISFSPRNDLLFVTCMADSGNSSTKSSVEVFDMKTLTMVKVIDTGYQPRGLAVDDRNDVVYVANRNISPTGWTPHHTTSCGGRNGYVTLINMKTLKLEEKWFAEVSVDPYAVAIKK